MKLIIHHMSGSRTTEVDVVSMQAHRELILGRAGSAAVRFHPRSDRSVGRHHARIIRDADEPTQLLISDLGSRNGTFLNGHRVESATPLHAGDVVQLGTNGPQLRMAFDTEP